MEIKNSYYSNHQTDRCKDVPENLLRDIVNELLTNIRFYMSSDLTAESMLKVTDAVMDLLKGHFCWLPLHLVGEAFVKGSLGEIGGTSRITVRNIYIWLKEIEGKSNNLTAQEISKRDDQRRAESERLFKMNQAHNVSYGTALYIKLKWVYENRIYPDNWDYYTLDAIVEQLKAGKTERTLKTTDIWLT